MPISEARGKANERYNAKAYDEIKVRVPKGHKAELQAHAEQRNESLNGFINRAIDTQLERDNRTATEIIEQDYLPLEQTIDNQFGTRGCRTRKFCNGCEKYLNCVEGKYMEEAKTATEILEQDYSERHNGTALDSAVPRRG